MQHCSYSCSSEPNLVYPQSTEKHLTIVDYDNPSINSIECACLFKKQNRWFLEPKNKQFAHPRRETLSRSRFLGKLIKQICFVSIVSLNWPRIYVDQVSTLHTTMSWAHLRLFWITILSLFFSSSRRSPSKCTARGNCACDREYNMWRHVSPGRVHWAHPTHFHLCRMEKGWLRLVWR